MDKTVYSGTILGCVVLVIGSGWFPDNAAMWLASTSVLMNVVRGLICALMLGLVFTEPPRRAAFRAVLGTAAMVFLTAGVTRVFSGSIQLVDALIFFAAAAAFGLAAIEGKAVVQVAEAVPQRSLFEQRDTQVATMPLALRPQFADISGIIARRTYTPASVLNRLIITVGVITGILYQNIRPFRVLWRGS